MLWDLLDRSEQPLFPLFSRAWVMQERILSPRFLIFGHSEILWECRTENKCDCGLYGLDYWNPAHPETMSDKRSLLPKAAYDKKIGRPTTEREIVSFLNKKWHIVVWEYTKKKITIDNHIFPALQGIAKLYWKETNHTYCAGLWAETLIMDLGWSTLGTNQPVHRPRVWRAPSWSWASIVGSVVYGAHGEEVASVVSVTTSPTSQSPFGQLKSASLVLRGKYLDALLHRRDDEPTVTAEDNSECTTHFHADYDYDWAIEESKYIPCGSRVRIMWMLHNENYDFFLILRCVNEDTEMFERIGCLNLFQGNEAHVAFQHYFKATSQEEEILIV